jgi:hypothetical protein
MPGQNHPISESRRALQLVLTTIHSIKGYFDVSTFQFTNNSDC